MLAAACNPAERKRDQEHAAPPDHTGHANQQDHHEDSLEANILALAGSVNDRILSSVATIKVEAAERISTIELTGRFTPDPESDRSVSSRIGGRIERLHVRYNFQSLKKGEPILELYSPELVNAQQDYLSLLEQHEGDLLEKSRQRLLYLGLTEHQIRTLTESKLVNRSVTLYSPASGYLVEKAANVTTGLFSSSSEAGSQKDAMGMGGSGSISGSASAGAGTSASSSEDPASSSLPRGQSALQLQPGQYIEAGERLFTLYDGRRKVADFYVRPEVAAALKVGQRVLYRPEHASSSHLGKIGTILPVLAQGERFATLRVYLQAEDMQIGELLKGVAAIKNRKGFWLPADAVVSLGNRWVLFRKSEGLFEPVIIQVGQHRANEVQVLTDINKWEIASNASYLVDSESFITTN